MEDGVGAPGSTNSWNRKCKAKQSGDQKIINSSVLLEGIKEERSEAKQKSFGEGLSVSV